jgi:hypothetical protein
MSVVTIDGVAYRRVDGCSEKRIVVLHRGWVFVGDVEEDDDGEVVIYNAKCIRKWGTTKGLGELRSGPTSKTVTDDAGTVRCSYLAVVLFIDCDEGSWT